MGGGTDGHNKVMVNCGLLLALLKRLTCPTTPGQVTKRDDVMARVCSILESIVLYERDVISMDGEAKTVISIRAGLVDEVIQGGLASQVLRAFSSIACQSAM